MMFSIAGELDLPDARNAASTVSAPSSMIAVARASFESKW